MCSAMGRMHQFSDVAGDPQPALHFVIAGISVSDTHNHRGCLRDERLAGVHRISVASRIFNGTFGAVLAVAAAAFAVEGGTTVRLIALALVLLAMSICGCARLLSPRRTMGLSVLLLSGVLSLFAAEGILRWLTVHPVNQQSNTMRHAELGYVLDPALPDIDASGFRNAAVLQSAEIVAIGDSHTQGFNATSEDAWPALLSRELKRSVYNMGVGGYGPRHYERLCEQALELHPKRIVVGLYLGNDLFDATQVIQPRSVQEACPNPFRHALASRTAIGSATRQLYHRSGLGRPSGRVVRHPLNSTVISEKRVHWLSQQMDLARPEITDALRITTEILFRARERCAKNGVHLTVMLIPTRESVYCCSQRVVQDTLPGTLRQLAQNEAGLRNILIAELQESHIRVVDLFEPLVAALDSVPGIYAAHDDGHPTANGYRVYATTLAVHLTTPHAGDSAVAKLP